jgi:hypothetical protein
MNDCCGDITSTADDTLVVEAAVDKQEVYLEKNVLLRGCYSTEPLDKTDTCYSYVNLSPLIQPYDGFDKSFARSVSIVR